ncbi:hypothetical protein Q4503_16665 [Colwellia sp. 6_MG-2023]|uniref:hypothetical protein n=1 Tax=Colwellia sp. 6_MG-2023 TaxID=3062676 RepID=UPI0026E1BFAD|nr:hypothetical protein [Colwellia sp. 6_MG-2023]MDO6489330.1 hypothetical protein [Colwellia sp. 6_MG-2023]
MSQDFEFEGVVISGDDLDVIQKSDGFPACMNLLTTKYQLDNDYAEYFYISIKEFMFSQKYIKIDFWLLPCLVHEDEDWVTSSDLAKELGYSDSKGVTRLYSRYKDEFTDDMSIVIELPSDKNNNLKVKTRVFSFEGCCFIGGVSRANKAPLFRKAILNCMPKDANFMAFLAKQKTLN